METSSVIILDSDSDDGGAVKRGAFDSKRKPKATMITMKNSVIVNENGKRSITASSGAQEVQPVVRKRIKPITIASNFNNNVPAAVTVDEHFAPITYSEDWEQDMKQFRKEIAVQSSTSTLAPATPTNSTTDEELEPNNRRLPQTYEQTLSSVVEKTVEVTAQSRNGDHLLRGKNAIGKEFQQLLDACRKADPSKEMEMLIEKKLLRYYEVVHQDYVNSKSFLKAVTQVTADVLAHPTLVFLKLSSIVEELNIRRKSGLLLPAQRPPTIGEDGNGNLARDSNSTSHTKKDRQIAKLNRTLYCLTKRIKQLDQADVDFNHENNSTYLMSERYKKRAFEVYEKLCDITGESKNAHRLVRKPIHFKGTPYADFNNTLQMFVNRTNTFPNFRDVLKCLQHCNTRFGYGLRMEQMNQMAQDAFCKIGRQLQKRRKTDLYETVVYHAGEEKDPALIDLMLRKKLDENGKHYGKVNRLIEKYAQHEHVGEEDPTDLNSEITKTAGSQTPSASCGDTASQNTQSKPSSSDSSMKAPSATTTGSPGATKHKLNGELEQTLDSDGVEDEDDGDDDDDDDEDDDDEEDEDEEEEEECESTTKENVRPDNFEDIVISDDEELLVPES